MKKSVLAMALFPVAVLYISSAWAANPDRPLHPKWVAYSLDPQMVSYIDVGSIHRTWGLNSSGVHAVLTATAWFLYDYPLFATDGAMLNFYGKKVPGSHSDWSSMMVEERFDCQNERSKTLRVLEFRGHKGSGRLIDAPQILVRWVPNSTADTKQQEGLACIGLPYRYLKHQGASE